MSLDNIILFSLMTVGDVLGWIGVITVFILVWMIIYYLWRRAGSSSGGSDNKLSRILDQLDLLERQIKRLTEQLTEMTAQRDELKKQAQDYIKLKKELEENKSIESKELTPLLVVTGSDSLLKLDIASLRAVETETGLTFQRLENATLESLKRRLDRARSYGRPIDKIHMSVHSSPEGILLGGTIIDSDTLSEVLRDVNILVIAGCSSSNVGDFLGVVPYVITLNEEVDNTDAALFARAFWTQIGDRLNPKDALRVALQRSPSGMSEYIEKHF